MREIWEMCRKYMPVIIMVLYMLMCIILPYVLPDDIQKNRNVNAFVSFVAYFVPSVEKIGEDPKAISNAQTLMAIYVTAAVMIYFPFFVGMKKTLGRNEEKFHKAMKAYSLKARVALYLFGALFLVVILISLFDKDCGGEGSYIASVSGMFYSREKAGFLAGVTLATVVMIIAGYTIHAQIYYRDYSRKRKTEEITNEKNRWRQDKWK